jgi:hypothetical protein
MESNDKLEQLLRQMYAEETDTSELVDEEWKKFEAEHFSNRSDHPQPFLLRRGKKYLVAASIIGVLMLSATRKPLSAY